MGQMWYKFTSDDEKVNSIWVLALHPKDAIEKLAKFFGDILFKLAGNENGHE